MFLRFSVRRPQSGSSLGTGLFTELYRLSEAGDLTPAEVAWFAEQEQWFNEHLARPANVADGRAVLWFRATATEHVRRMRALAALLEARDIEVAEFKSERPGSIVYEDAAQIAAVPYRDSVAGI